MEFERALFRIHQKTLQSEAIRKVIFRAYRILPAIVGFLVLSLIFMHTEYVGQAHCLPIIMKRAGLWNSTSKEPHLPEDLVISLSVVAGDDVLGQRWQMPRLLSPSRSSALAVASENKTVLVEHNEVEQPRVLLSYRFALDRELLHLQSGVFKEHGFQVRNLSVSESCLAPSRFLGDALLLLDGYDGIIINELAYSFRSRGFLERTEGGKEVESWLWTEGQVESPGPLKGRSLVASFVRKVNLLLESLIAFTMISAVTGMFIRVAVAGSAVLMFPLAMLAQATGSSAARLSLGVLVRSFPWVGVHLEVLRRGNRPLWPLVRSQAAFLLLQSFAYLACNLAWRFIVYRKSLPEGFEERIFGLCSMLELFNLLFVRTVASAKLFPKAVAATVVYLHFYIFCSLYPFHNLAFAVCCAVCVYVMVLCLKHYEEPALRGDQDAFTTPTAVHPRALYMPQLSPSWAVESAPLWTMFYSPSPPTQFPEEALRQFTNAEYLMP